ncbi:helix-turn-helix transcriptional regulator [Erythrobacter litoralis]|uniref:response regulator transcription factor n=1 Tax=Erythrobacter litoralis TaxID=39960 RepID=UPI002435009B|nr:LuxR C-terminal-related transcriptional regulator [Erythrobacter litoralis]MDG6077586.1 helix-turn-helix transcriptional regulator [Erythrobacter litoralis]
MDHFENIVHMVDGFSGQTSAIAEKLGQLGYRVNFFINRTDFLRRPPATGILIVADEVEDQNAATFLAVLETAEIWLPAIAIAESPRPDAVVATIKAGALDYLSADCAEGDLKQAIDRIASEAGEQLEARHRMQTARRRLNSLTSRERQVLDLVARGFSNKMIARDLDISPRTVEIHRANMMAKIGARHAAEAVKILVEASGDPIQALAA